MGKGGLCGHEWILPTDLQERIETFSRSFESATCLAAAPTPVAHAPRSHNAGPCECGTSLQASGRATTLLALLQSQVERGADFLRLANALTALYPTGSDEKRLLDAVLMAIPR